MHAVRHVPATPALDWRLLEKYSDVHWFVNLLLAQRLSHHPERQRASLQEVGTATGTTWREVIGEPDWGPYSHTLSFGLEAKHEGLLFHVLVNASWEPLDFELPQLDAGDRFWRRWIDTALEAPHDIVPWEQSPIVEDHVYRVADHSLVILLAHTRAAERRR
jgi:glycogen operon protein